MNIIGIDGSNIVLVLLVVLILLLLFKGISKVGDGTTRIVERLGKRHKILYPGINIIVPFLDTEKKITQPIETYVDNGATPYSLVRKNRDISMAEHRMDPPVLSLIAKDNNTINVNAVAYFRIVDPMRIVYDVDQFAETLKSLVETTLRQEVGKLDSDAVISSREQISSALRTSLQEASTNWGVSIIRVEIEDISFSADVQQQLAKAREQELIRRAQIVAAREEAEKEVIIAEGKRKAAELVAEGDKQATILRAQGAFEEAKLAAEASFLEEARKAEGEAQGYAAIVKALSGKGDAIVALEALKSQEKVAEALGQSDSSLIIPNEAAGLFGAFSSVIKALDASKAKK